MAKESQGNQMELEVVAGGHDGLLVGCSVDLLQEPEHRVLRKKYHEKGHDGIIGCMASGGRYLASGGTDETIQLYDMRKHVSIGTLLHHEASITCLCFHKETFLLSASEDGVICLWSCGRGWDLLHTFSGHKYSVTSVAVHPSGKLALSVGRDRTVRTWDLSTGRAAFTLRLPKAADLVVWSPIGDQYVLAVGETLMVYSVESGECTVVIQVEKQINSIAFPQDSVVALGTESPDVLLYSTSTGQEITRLSGHSNRVKGLAVSPDGRLLFSVSSDGAIKAWSLPKSLEDCRCVSTLDAGLRLTCVTALLPEKLSERGGGKGKRKGEKNSTKAERSAEQEELLPEKLSEKGGKRRGVKSFAKAQSVETSAEQEELKHKNKVKTAVQDTKPTEEGDMTGTAQGQDTEKSLEPSVTLKPKKRSRQHGDQGEGKPKKMKAQPGDKDMKSLPTGKPRKGKIRKLQQQRRQSGH